MSRMVRFFLCLFFFFFFNCAFSLMQGGSYLPNLWAILAFSDDDQPIGGLYDSDDSDDKPVATSLGVGGEGKLSLCMPRHCTLIHPTA